VYDCKLIQEGYEELSLSPSASDMNLSMLNDQYGVTKKSPQVKFSDSNALYVFPQEVQKFFQNAMTTSCQIDSLNLITLVVFNLNIGCLSDNGCSAEDSNGDIVCSDMVVIGRGVKQGSVSFVEDHLFQTLQCLPCYCIKDLHVYVIAALVKLNNVSIIAIMHECVYLGKDKFFHSSAPSKYTFCLGPL